MKNSKLTILAIFFFIGIFMLGFFISRFYSENEILNVPNKCYTNLQASNYLSKLSPSPIVENSEGYIKIENINNRKFSTVQVANTGSMRPAIPDYATVIVIKNITENDLFVGDIISVRRDSMTLVLHRIVKITDSPGIKIYTTKGDNNANNDPEAWRISDIQNKVIGVIY